MAIDESRRLLYVADTGNHVIRSVSLDTGVVATLAGSGRPDDKDGAGAQAGFKQPAGLAVDAAGTLFVADTGNSRIKQITPSGVVATIAGGVHEGFANGPAAQALLKQPEGITVTPTGAIYVADTGNNVIRRLQGGQVSTVAGTGHAGNADGLATIAEFKSPSGLSADEAGDLYVADAKNNAIRRVALAGSTPTVTTLSGSGKAGFADGPPASALFREPGGVTFAGALYVADTGNDAIRRIDPGVTTAAIDPSSGSPDGGAPVRVFGSGFAPGLTQVAFGSAPATAITWITSTELLATTPAGSPGSVDVTVTTPAGSSTLSGAWSYTGAPGIATVTPRKGRGAGGELVTITGTNLTSPAQAFFGTGAATSVNVISANSLKATTPAGTGTVDVAVTTSAGTATKPAAFTFFATPVIAAFAPAQGPVGTTVAITGANFDPDPAGNAIQFGNFSAPVTSASSTQLVTAVPNGVTTSPITVTTTGGSATSTGSFSTASIVALEVTAPVTAFTQGDRVPYNALARLSDGTSSDVSQQATWTSSASAVATVAATGAVTGVAGGSATITATFGAFAASKPAVIQPLAIPVLHPTAVDRTVVQPLADSVRFLYTGPGAVQTGVAPNTINDDRVATVRGSVHDRGGNPISGVMVTVVNHPELGATLTRGDGVFDLAFNGGGAVTLRYAKAGYLEAQRLVTSQWKDQKIVDDLVLVGFDTSVTAATMGASLSQVARATMVSDQDGQRRATLLIPAGETGTIVAPDGSVTSATTLHVRATEYTVGNMGLSAMPAVLPATSAYTYCVELSADEAPNGKLQFSRPIPFYVENFIRFPVGSAVPVGYYDRASSTWNASPNGRVVKILGVVDQLVTLDTDGDGSADDPATLAILGIDDAERKALASLYPAGQTLWRVSVDHFTPFDMNWPVVAPADAEAPDGAPPSWTPPPDSKSASPACGASVVDCTNQTLSESIPIEGTPFTLEYSSSRAGAAQFRTTVHVSGSVIPSSLKRIELRVSIAGQSQVVTFPAQANLAWDFTWDGRDGFGRIVQGARRADLQTDYVYDGVYSPRIGDQLAWAVAGGPTGPAARALTEVRLSASSNILLGHVDAGSSTGFGGWTLSAQTFFDGVSGTIYEGDGTERSIDPSQIGERSISTVAGNGSSAGNSPDGTAPTAASLDLFSSTVAPDGTIYLTDGYRIRRITPAGHLDTIAGTSGSGFTPDGTLAFGNPVDVYQIRTSPDGTLYVTDFDLGIVRKLSAGRWVTVAGTGTSFGAAANSPLPDGVPARSRPLWANAMAFAPDGTLYLGGNRCLFRVDPDGIIHTIAGGPAAVPAPDFVDGAQALSVAFGSGWYQSLATGPDGSVYFSVYGGPIGRVTPQGLMVHVVTGTSPQSIVDARNIAVSADGTVLLAAEDYGFVYAVRPDGTMTTLAGTGQFSNTSNVPAPSGAARSTIVSYPWDVAVAPDGSVLVLDLAYESLRRVEASFPRASSNGQLLFTSRDGSLVYEFEGGRHTRTVDAITGAEILALGYDGAGSLTSVTDRDGLVTAIQRDGGGVPTAIVAPNGQRTILSVSVGQLMAVNDPAGASYALEYATNGLLGKFTDRRGGLHQFTYDANGFLINDSDPAGGFIGLTRTGEGRTFSVHRTSAEGRSQSYGAAVDALGHESHTHLDTAGLRTTSTFFGSTSSVAWPDGTSITTTSTPDPRFGMMAPLDSTTVTTGTHTLNLKRTRSVTLADPNNVLSLTSLTEALKVNANTWTSTYNAATRVVTQLSPAGRQSSATLDAKGRVILVQRPSISDGTVTYDTRGRVASVAQGSRSTTFSYDGADRLASITDPLSRTVSFAYDAANRVTMQTLPDGRAIGFTWDAGDNLTAVTPPSRPAHGFRFTPVDLLDTYTPPTVPNGGVTTYRYNRDRQLTLITRPDGEVITPGYDTAGRLTTLATSASTNTFAYDSAGRLSGIANSNGPSLTYRYDGALLTQQQWTGAVSGSTSYTYDTDLHLASENGIAFSYDADGLLTSAGALTLTRDAQTGFLTGTTLGNLTDAWTYNGFGEPMSYTASYSGTTWFGETVNRDDAGRITAKTESILGTPATTSYGYDTAGRLTTVTKDSTLTATYAYDENSNRTTKTTPLVTETATYDAQDRMLTYAGTTFVTNANGDLTSKTDATGTTTYAYDALGNLRTVNLPDGRPIEYVIDAQNRRVGKKIDGTLVQGWLYAGQLRIAAELDGTGAVVSQFVYGSRSNVPDFMIKGGVTYRIISDHLGSPRLVVDTATGTIAESIGYDEFGNVTSDSNPGFQPFGFAGGLYDRDTGLVRFGARDYDPHTGRWTAKDPIAFSGGDANLYGYVFGDPINFIDFDGLRALTPQERSRITRAAKGWKGTPYNRTPGQNKGPKGRNGGADCSGSTWGIYQDAGLPYVYSPSATFRSHPRFKPAPGNVPQPGDVGWWNGHIAIYDPEAADDPDAKDGSDIWSARREGVPYGPAKSEWWGPAQWFTYDVPDSGKSCGCDH